MCPTVDAKHAGKLLGVGQLPSVVDSAQGINGMQQFTCHVWLTFQIIFQFQLSNQNVQPFDIIATYGVFQQGQISVRIEFKSTLLHEVHNIPTCLGINVF